MGHLVGKDLNRWIAALSLVLGAFLAACAAGGGADGGGGLPPVPVLMVPRFAYVANSLDNTVSVYAVDYDTGQLRPRGYVMTGTGPEFVAVHPSGKFVYVANRVSSDVSAFSITAATGALTPVAGSPFAVHAGPRSITVDPSGKFMYVANGALRDVRANVSAFTIDATTGALAPISGPPSPGGDEPTSVAVDPSGKFLYVAYAMSGTVSAFTINATNGALTPVEGSPFVTGSFPSSVAVDPGGKFLYVANQGSLLGVGDVSAFTINVTTGALTPVSGSPFAVGKSPYSVAVDPSGKFVYVANDDRYAEGLRPGTVSAFTIIAATGALTPVSGSPFDVGDGPTSVTVDPSGRFLYAVNRLSTNVSAFKIDVRTGKLSPLSTTPLTATRGEPISIAMVAGAAPVKYKPKFAYVTNKASHSISTYSVDAASGALATLSGSPFATGAATFPRSVALHPTGRFAYVATEWGRHDLDSTVSAYTIDAVTGALALVGEFVAGSWSYSIAVDPSGRFVYGTSRYFNSLTAFTIDATTGALIAPGKYDAGTGPNSVAVDPTGRFVYVANQDSNNVSAFTIDVTTGALTPVSGSPFAAGDGPRSVTVDPSGRFVYVANALGSLANNRPPSVSGYHIGKDGALTAIAGSPVSCVTGCEAVGVDPSGRYLYVTLNSNKVSVYKIDGWTGGLTAWGAFATGDGPRFVTVDPSGKFAYTANYVSGAVSAFSIDATNGSLVPVGGAPFAAGAQPTSIAVSETLQ